MKSRLCVCLLAVLFFFACNKNEPAAAGRVGEAASKVIEPGCAKEIVTDQPVKVGETGLLLPVGSKLCFSADNLEIKVELPEGYNFLSNRTLPFYATYTCNCSASGSACQVFYASGMGFGCLQSSCTGACTGQFTYKGYTVDRVVKDKTEFFNLPEVQKEITLISSDEPYSKESVYGVSFYLVNDEKIFLAAASCDCQGTAACKLKTISIPFVRPGGEAKLKIYYCEGGCNGCELTVNK